METDQLSRKLAVILHADVVGSTSLVQKDEALAHERIQSAFKNFSEYIHAYGGIAREIRGDALVAEFGRASDAVTAALAFQALNESMNTEIVDDLKPSLRIGISLGEVVVADEKMSGAGVVLAQRLEQLAEPGGVVVQGSVYETVPDRLPLEFESLGEQQLKGFDQPVRAFTTQLKAGSEIPKPEVVPIRIASSLRQDSDKPSIAVLPFTNLGGDSQQEFFSDGITQDIISALSRFKTIHVVSYHSVQQYKENTKSIDAIASEQGVRYILEGRVRTSDNRIRVNTDLIDSETGTNCWVEQYDRELLDIFRVQDDITKNIAVAMRVKLTGGDRDRGRAKGTESIKAWGLAITAEDLLDEYKSENIVEARRMVDEAIELDPNYCNAWVIKGWVHWEEAFCGWKDFDISLLEAEKAATRAQELDPNDAEAWSLVSLIDMLKHDPVSSVEAGRKAVELNPGSAEAHSLYASALLFAEHFDEAWFEYEKSLTLSPIYPAHYLLVGAGVCRAKGKFKEAYEIYQRCINLQPDSALGRFYFMNALLENGEESRAKILADEIRAIDPTYGIFGLATEFSYKKDKRDRFIANLGKMGFVK